MKAPLYPKIDAELRRALNVRAAEQGTTATNAPERAIRLYVEDTRPGPWLGLPG